MQGCGATVVVVVDTASSLEVTAGSNPACRELFTEHAIVDTPATHIIIHATHMYRG